MFVSIIKSMESRGKFAMALPNHVTGAEFINAYLNEKLGEKESIEKIIGISRMTEKELDHYLQLKQMAKIKSAEHAARI